MHSNNVLGKKKGEDNFTMPGSYAYLTPESEQKWGWRNDIEIINEDEVNITAYNVSPEGQEVKATETHYKKIM